MARNCPSDCPVDEQERRRKGCGVDSDKAQLEIMVCVRCAGSDSKCTMCRGENITPIMRCPISLIDDQAEHALRLYFYFKAGFLPASGGIEDQTRPFLDAMRLIQSDIARARPEERGAFR